MPILANAPGQSVRIGFSSTDADSGGIHTIGFGGATPSPSSIAGLGDAGKAFVIYFVAAKALSCAGNWADTCANTVLEGPAKSPAGQLHTLFGKLNTGAVAQRSTPVWLQPLFPDAHLANSVFLRLIRPEKTVRGVFLDDYQDSVLSIDSVYVRVGRREQTDFLALFSLVVELLGLSTADVESPPKESAEEVSDKLRFLFLLQRRLLLPYLGLDTPKAKTPSVDRARFRTRRHDPALSNDSNRDLVAGLCDFARRDDWLRSEFPTEETTLVTMQKLVSQRSTA